MYMSKEDNVENLLYSILHSCHDTPGYILRGDNVLIINSIQSKWRVGFLPTSSIYIPFKYKNNSILLQHKDYLI